MSIHVSGCELHYTVVTLYVATLARGHPSYEAMISENKLCIIVSKIPFTRGHPSNKARFAIPQGWPYKRGTTVLISYMFNNHQLNICLFVQRLHIWSNQESGVE